MVFTVKVLINNENVVRVKYCLSTWFRYFFSLSEAKILGASLTRNVGTTTVFKAFSVKGMFWTNSLTRTLLGCCTETLIVWVTAQRGGRRGAVVFVL